MQTNLENLWFDTKALKNLRKTMCVHRNVKHQRKTVAFAQNIQKTQRKQYLSKHVKHNRKHRTKQHQNKTKQEAEGREGERHGVEKLRKGQPQITDFKFFNLHQNIIVFQNSESKDSDQHKHFK